MRPADLLNELGPHDLAGSIVRAVYPDQGIPLWDVLFVFASSLTAAGAFFLGWHIISGLVASAYTGRAFGERTHQIWAPLRIVLGFAIIVPMPGSLPAGPWLVYQSANVAGQLGNIMWSTFVGRIAGDGQPLLATSAGGRSLAVQLLESEVCHAVQATDPYRQYTGQVPALPAAMGADVGGAWYSFSDAAAVWDWGRGCGTLRLSMPADAAEFAEVRRAAVAGAIAVIRESGIPALYAEQYRTGGALDQTPTLIESMLQRGHLPPLADILAGAGDAYDRGIREAASLHGASVAAEERANLVRVAEERGFATMGLYWRALAQSSAVTTPLATERAERTEPRLAELSAAPRRAVEAVRATLVAETDPLPLSGQDFAGIGDQSSDLMTRFLAPIYRVVAEWATSSEAVNDPNARMVSLGHNLLAAVPVVLAAVAGILAAANSIVGDTVGAGAAASFIVGWGNWLLGIIIVVGTVHAYVLPMVPFIISLLVLIRWATMILVAMISSLLWGFMFIRTDGDNLADQAQRQGFLLGIEVLLAPALAVFAFCATFYLQPALLNLVAELWGPAFTGQQGGHLMGLWSWIVGIVLLTYVQWHVSLRLFSLALEMPDHMLRIVGVSGSNAQDGTANTALVAGVVAASRSSPDILSKPERREGAGDEQDEAGLSRGREKTA